MSELSGPRVAVCLATFRRPAELDRILPVLVEQRAALSPPASIIVVDNDPDAGARDQVAAAITRFKGADGADGPGAGGGISYVHEPTPGIAAARNAAIDAALADVAALAQPPLVIFGRAGLVVGELFEQGIGDPRRCHV